MVLPEGNGAWSVRVVTSGGFMGNGIGTFALSSERKVACNEESRCPKGFKASEFEALIQPIRADAFSMPDFPSNGLCADCITRTMSFTDPASTGVVHTHTVSWNELTRSHVPQELLRLYD